MSPWKIQVIAREVGEHRRVEAHGCDARLREAVAKKPPSPHGARRAAPEVRELALHGDGIRRGHLARDQFAAAGAAQRAQIRRRAAHRVQRLGQQQAQVVLPLVPVMPTTASSREGNAKNRAASSLARRDRSGTSASTMSDCSVGARTFPSGSHRIAAAPWRTTSAVNSSPWRRAPRQARKAAPGPHFATVEREIGKRHIAWRHRDIGQQAGQGHGAHRLTRVETPAGGIERRAAAGIRRHTHQAKAHRQPPREHGRRYVSA